MMTELMKKIALWLLILNTLSPIYSQRGGETVYNFLQLTNSARVAALGGENVSLADDDINLVFHNPALLNSSMDQHMNLNYINYYAGINYGYTSYAFDKGRIGTFAAGIHYVDYGKFQRRDQYGNMEGHFRAAEHAINLIYSRPLIDSILYVGANVKPIFSLYEQYTSLGLTADLGMLYRLKTTNTDIGFVFRNFGTQITSYSGTREPVPFEIQLGITQSLEHAPFRFHVQFQHLEMLDLTYETEEADDIFGTGQEAISKFDVLADKVMRHAIFGAELHFGKSFHFDFGYNYKRRQEMKMNSWPGMVGFSWGVGFRVSRFHIAYGRATYHLAGGTNHFSITTDLSTFYKSSN